MLSLFVFVTVFVSVAVVSVEVSSCSLKLFALLKFMTGIRGRALACSQPASSSRLVSSLTVVAVVVMADCVVVIADVSVILSVGLWRSLLGFAVDRFGVAFKSNSLEINQFTKQTILNNQFYTKNRCKPKTLMTNFMLLVLHNPSWSLLRPENVPFDVAKIYK